MLHVTRKDRVNRDVSATNEAEPSEANDAALPFGIQGSDPETKPPTPAIDGAGTVPPVVEAPASAAPEPSRDPWDLSRLRLSQDFASAAGVKKVLTVVPVRKPDKTWFVRTHRDHHLQTAVIELKEDRETYLVSPDLWAELASESMVSPRLLVLSVNRQGNLFVWPVKLPGPDGKIDSWSRSSLDAVNMARDAWVRVAANMSLGAYDVSVAPAPLAPPSWPSLPFREIIKLAFRDNMIDSMDHPVLKRLRGEI